MSKSLKWFIRNNGFSQKKIAGALGISQSTFWGKINKENPDIETVKAVCKAMDMPISRYLSDIKSDDLVSISDQERELLQAFREFSEDKRVKVLRFVKDLGEF